MSQEELDEMMKLLESYESGGKIFGPVPEELHVSAMLLLLLQLLPARSTTQNMLCLLVGAGAH